MWDLCTRIWREFVVRRLFTVPAICLAFSLLFLLPQTTNVMWQLPAPDNLTLTGLLSSGFQWLAILILLACYLILWLVLNPYDSSDTRTSGEGRRWFVRVRNRGDVFLDNPVDWLARRSARWGWISLIVALSALVLTLRFNAWLPAWWRVSGLTYATVGGFLGIWLICVSRGRRSNAAASDTLPSHMGYKSRLTGRALVILIGTMLLGQILWALPELFPGSFAPRIYTVWAVIQIAFLIVMTAGVIDACHVHSEWNIRALAVFGVILWLFLVPNQKVGGFWRLPPRPTDLSGPPSDRGGPGIGKFMPSAQMPPETGSSSGKKSQSGQDKSPVLPMDDTLTDIWFRSMEAKLEATDPDHPVIFLAASGGGARAALFTSLVLEALRATPLPSVSRSGGPVPPVASSAQRAESRSLADQIVLISSVSGGSLATAYYVSQSFAHLRVLRDRELPLDQQQAEGVAPRPRIRYAWHNTSPSELYMRMHTRAIRMLDMVRQGRGRAVRAWAGPRFEEAVERVAYECERLALGRNTWQSSASTVTPIAPWLATSAFVDDMATDFMAPLLRGILTPGIERGVSVTRYWEDRFGWRNVEDTDLHRRPHPEHPELGTLPNAAPPVLFNACDVTQGSRLILGFPPLPAGIIRDPLALPSSHLPYSLTDLGDSYYHLSLAEAVRLSANFPFGFEVGELPLSGGESTILVLDGGIVDNSGIDSIVYLLQGLDRLSKAYREKWAQIADKYEHAIMNDEKADLQAELTSLTCQSIEGRAYRLMGQLARRKVLLIQVDSGAKEIQTGGSGLSSLLAGLSPGLFRPFQALNNATTTNADQAVENYDLALRILRPLPEPPFDCTNEPIMFPQMEPPAPQAPAKVMPEAQAPSKTIPSGGISIGAGVRGIPKPAEAIPEMPPLIFRVRLTCNQFANVMTAWTLGPEDKAQVLVQFLIEWEHQRPVILKSLEMLSRIVDSGGDSMPGSQPVLPIGRNLSVARDYLVYKVGQKLVDRARAEFYQMVSSPAGLGPISGNAALPLLDDLTKQELKQFDRLFSGVNPTGMETNPTVPVPLFNGPLPIPLPQGTKVPSGDFGPPTKAIPSPLGSKPVAPAAPIAPLLVVPNDSSGDTAPPAPPAPLPSGPKIPPAGTAPPAPPTPPRSQPTSAEPGGPSPRT